MIRSAVPPILTGITASLLVIAGQCVIEAKDKHEQQEEIARLVVWLEQQTFRDLIQLSVDGIPDIAPEESPKDTVLLGGFSGLGGQVEVFLTANGLDNAREELQLGELRGALDTLSLHLDSRATLVSAKDRHSFRTAIHDTNATITKFIALSPALYTN